MKKPKCKSIYQKVLQVRGKYDHSIFHPDGFITSYNFKYFKYNKKT